MTNAELKAIVQREEYDFLRTNKHLGSNILFLTLSGSHAYGTNVEGSDIDIRGVAGSPEILGFNHFEQAIDNRTDTVICAVLSRTISRRMKANDSWKSTVVAGTGAMSMTFPARSS